MEEIKDVVLTIGGGLMFLFVIGLAVAIFVEWIQQIERDKQQERNQKKFRNRNNNN